MLTETKATFSNPFIPIVLRALQQHSSGLKIYELLPRLDGELLSQLVNTDDQHLALFRKNFWMMNALYQLQDSLRGEQVHVDIGAVDIKIRTTDLSNDDDASQTSSKQALNTDDRQTSREYYLDWSHYENTSTEDVEALLDDFWSRYHDPESLTTACSVLEVSIEDDWSTIQTRYRKLAQQHHPDKGGDTQQFIRIREAYEVLSQQRKSRAS